MRRGFATELQQQIGSALILTAGFCATFASRHDERRAPRPRTWARKKHPAAALLPAMCPGGERSADLWRLLRRDLPDLRNSAGIARRAGNGL